MILMHIPLGISFPVVLSISTSLMPLILALRSPVDVRVVIFRDPLSGKNIVLLVVELSCIKKQTLLFSGVPGIGVPSTAALQLP